MMWTGLWTFGCGLVVAGGFAAWVWLFLKPPDMQPDFLSDEELAAFLSPGWDRPLKKELP